MDTLRRILTAKEAIEAGHRHFTDVMSGEPTPRVLLEGVKFDAQRRQWIVTFGFDSERERVLTGMDRIVTGAFPFAPEFESVREFRAIHIAASDGAFIKMDRG